MHAERKPAWGYLGMALVTLVTLLLELLFTRIISVLAHYHLAFFIISLAVLGMTVGAILTYVFPDHFEARRALPAYARLFFLSIPLSVGFVFAIVQTDQQSLTGVLALVLAALLTGVPFLLSGILISLTLTRCALPYGRIYAADLLGAAAGCLLFLPALDRLSPGGLALGLSGLGALAAVCYSRLWGETVPRLEWVWLPVMVVLILLTETTGLGLVPLTAKGKPIARGDLQFVKWNNHSLVMVGRIGRHEAFLWGGRGRGIAHSLAMLTIDGDAATPILKFDGNLDPLRWLNRDVTSLGFQVRQPESAAVIGVGGGRDVLAALLNGANRVVGIEVNPLIIDLHHGKHAPALAQLCQLAKQPGVTLVAEEARSFLTRAPDRFDVIQMSLVDTWAASAAGAFTLTENGLYTLEAWDVFLGRLTDKGLFSASRWYSASGADEASRALSLAVAACLKQGLTPVRDHIALATGGNVATVLISRAPLTGPRAERLREVCREQQFTLLLTPGQAPSSPLYQQLIDCQTPAELAAICHDQILDISPPSDDRPYFFNQLRLTRPDALTSNYGGLIGNLRATITVFLVLAISLGGVAAGIFWPLRRVGLPAGFPPRVFRLGLAYFGAIGLGFMLVEMAMVQRFSVLLGHPSYALACVIGSMVLATGIGSALSERLPVERPATFLAYPIVVVVVLTLAWMLLPLAFAAAILAPLPTRIAVTLAFTIPCGLVMGTCLPLGMYQLARYDEAVAPWMWGINGAASVVGTILSVLLSINLGISTTFLIGIGCYVLMLWVNVKLSGQPSAVSIQPDQAVRILAES